MENLFTISSKTIFRREYFGGIANTLDPPRFYQVNRTTADVLSILQDETYSENDLVKILWEEYDQSYLSIKRDVRYLVNDLLHKGIIIRSEEQTGDIRVAKEKLESAKEEVIPDIISSPIEVRLYPTYACNQKCFSYPTLCNHYA